MIARSYAFAIAALSMLTALPNIVHSAENFPSAPLRLIAPFSPGSYADLTARLVAEGMSTKLNVAVVVENRPGASSMIGTAAGARAEPDGYTITMVGSPAVMASKLTPNAKYDLARDFEYIGGVNDFYNVLVVNPKLGIRTFGEFKSYVKKNPGKFNLATSGEGAPSDIGGRQMAKVHGLDYTLVPYKGATPVLTAVLSGEADGAIMIAGLATPHIKTNALIALGLTAPQRLNTLPEVPDANESGIRVITTGWTGLAAPTGTPASRIAVLNDALNVALKNEKVQKQFQDAGAATLGGTPRAMRDLVLQDLESSEEVLKSLRSKK